MQTNSVKQSVIDTYSKLAKSKSNKIFSHLFACCNPSENAHKVGEAIGYSKEQLDSVPENANLGVGCGNPSAAAAIEKGQVVVDLGSGAGFDAFIVSPIVSSTGKVIGIDLSDDMLNLARRNAAHGAFQNVEFIKGDIEDIPLSNEIADHVISNCVINLSQNKAQVYKEAFRILKNGGKLSVSDIVLERALPSSIKNALGGHIACVSGAEKLDNYLLYLKQAGFSDIQITSKVNFPLELMLADPQVTKIAKAFKFNLNSEEAKDIASRVISISLTAIK